MVHPCNVTPGQRCVQLICRHWSHCASLCWGKKLGFLFLSFFKDPIQSLFLVVAVLGVFYLLFCIFYFFIFLVLLLFVFCLFVVVVFWQGGEGLLLIDLKKKKDRRYLFNDKFREDLLW